MFQTTDEELEEINKFLQGLERENWRNAPITPVIAHFLANEESYLEEYPGKWIMVTLDGVVSVSDDLAGLNKIGYELLTRGVAHHVHFMEPKQES